MRRVALILLSIILSVPAFAQKTDRELIEEASISRQKSTSQKDTSAFLLRTEHIFRHQMNGMCYYEPECVQFFGPAVKELGFFGAVFASFDRLTRCSRIGTARRTNRAADGKIHEGPEVYKRKKQ